MNIVYVINAIKPSGPNEVLLNMVSGLAESHDITIVSFMSPNNEEMEKLEKLGVKNINLHTAKSKIPMVGAKRLRKILKEIKPDIVHSHGILSDIAVVRSGYSKKAVTTIHNNMFEDYIFTFGRIKGSIYVILHILYLQRFRKVICCSKYAAKELRHFVSKVSYVHNGIAIGVGKCDIDVRKKLNIPKRSRVFIYTGKLSTRKNIVKLIKDFKVCKKPTDYLLILGDGILKGECMKLVGDSSHILLLGFQSNVQPYLAQSDVYISLSRSEGFSISILEALRSNLLLLLSDIPSHREVFEVANGKNIGALVCNADLSKAMCSLTARNKASSDLFNNNFTNVKMMDKYFTIYEDIVR